MLAFSTVTPPPGRDRGKRQPHCNCRLKAELRPGSSRAFRRYHHLTQPTVNWPESWTIGPGRIPAGTFCVGWCISEPLIPYYSVNEPGMQETGKIRADRQWTEDEKRFRQQYMTTLMKYGIKGNEGRWMMIRAREYVLANRTVRPRDQSAEQVRMTLDELVGRAHLEDWQRTRIIPAVQILFRDSVSRSPTGVP